MVIYVDDQKEGGGCILVYLKPSDLDDMGVSDEDTMASIEAYPLQNLDILLPDEDAHLCLSRDDIDDPNDTQFSNIGEDFEADSDN